MQSQKCCANPDPPDQGPDRAGRGVVRDLREAGVGGPGPDRFLSPELRAAEDAVRDGSVLAAVEAAIGTLA